LRLHFMTVLCALPHRQFHVLRCRLSRRSSADGPLSLARAVRSPRSGPGDLERRFLVPPPTWGAQPLAGPEPPRRSSHRLTVMFRCQLCQWVVPPRTPSQRLVLQRRGKKYPHRSRANIVVRQREDDKKPKKEYVDDPGGAGQEIVREVTVCPACAARNGRR